MNNGKNFEGRYNGGAHKLEDLKAPGPSETYAEFILGSGDGGI